MSGRRLLVVEDDLGIASNVARGLRAVGYEIDLATDGAGVVDRILNGRYDLVVLDLMLPHMDGLAILDAIRDRTSVPVIVLTARTALPHRLQAFQAGAADYVAKPFFLEELIARIEARLGRVGQASRAISWGETAVDPDARTAFRNGRDVGLTPYEMNVLLWLVSRPGSASTRAQIVEATLSEDQTVSERTLDSHIARIRKKLGADGAAIATVWGIGYRFQPDTR